MLGKIAFDPKGDITVLDYVVYKWDAKGNYAELSEQGLVIAASHRNRKARRKRRAFFFSRTCFNRSCRARKRFSSQKLAVGDRSRSGSAMPVSTSSTPITLLDPQQMLAESARETPRTARSRRPQ